MKNLVIPMAVGLGMIIFNSFFPDFSWSPIVFYAGIAMVLISAVLFVRWVIAGTSGIPAVERLEVSDEDLREATPEILYMLDDGWGVKKIVDMVAANFELPPKMVYEHVMDLMASRADAVEAGGYQTGGSLDLPSKERANARNMEIYYDKLRDDEK